MPEERISNRGRSRPVPSEAPPTPPQTQSEPSTHDLHMGLGDAVLRLIHVESLHANAVDSASDLEAERLLLVEALNHHLKINLGMSCRGDGIPEAIRDSVSAITHSAKTSCCRISPGNPPQETPSKGRGFFATLFGT